MHFQTQEILFFTLNDHTAGAFERYVRFNKKEYKEMSEFYLIRDEVQVNKPKTFSHIRDLFFFMDVLSLQRLANLILIIDLYSLPEDDEKSNKKLLKELIISYPEVKIVFFSVGDDWQKIFEKQEIKCKIKTRCDDCSNLVDCKISLSYIHTFAFLKKTTSGLNDEYANEIMDFDLLIRGQSNLFDASNLRNVIKQSFCDKIKVRTNYPRSQCSRNNSFALVVEEELPQAYFNAYGMYVNGYRALPVVSCKEMDEVCEESTLKDSSLKLIIRDYDLQFEDYGSPDKLIELRGLKPNYDEENKTKFKFWEKKTDLWEKVRQRNTKTYFITRFDKNVHKNKPKVKLKINTLWKRKKADFDDFGIYITRNEEEAFLRGLAKPLNGLYELHDIKEIKKTYKSIRYEPDIDINREGEGEDRHATPPFIYHISENLLNRSKKYFSERMFMLSALLAKEALEVLNGFHFMLMLKAIHLHAIAETHLIVSTMGIDERILAKNTINRLKDIQNHVERICKDNPKARKNVLKQIYNDIRNILYEKEFFKAADMALNEFVNVDQGNEIPF